jgi:hypothetical protein
MLILQAFLDRARAGIEIERAGHGIEGDNAR